MEKWAWPGGGGARCAGSRCSESILATAGEKVAGCPSLLTGSLCGALGLQLCVHQAGLRRDWPLGTDQAMGWVFWHQNLLESILLWQQPPLAKTVEWWSDHQTSRSSSKHIFFLKDLFQRLSHNSGWGVQRDRPTTGSLPRYPQGLGLGQAEARHQEFHLVSYTSAGAPSTCTILCCLPRT